MVSLSPAEISSFICEANDLAIRVRLHEPLFYGEKIRCLSYY